MTKRKKYYLSLDRNGTEDEITIHAPNGRGIAFIWFWDDAECVEAAQKHRDAKLIVDALNAFRSRGRV